MQPKNWPVHALSSALAIVLLDFAPPLAIYSVDRLSESIAFLCYL